MRAPYIKIPSKTYALLLALSDYSSEAFIQFLGAGNAVRAHKNSPLERAFSSGGPIFVLLNQVNAFKKL